MLSTFSCVTIVVLTSFIWCHNQQPLLMRQSLPGYSWNQHCPPPPPPPLPINLLIFPEAKDFCASSVWPHAGMRFAHPMHHLGPQPGLLTICPLPFRTECILVCPEKSWENFSWIQVCSRPTSMRYLDSSWKLGTKLHCDVDDWDLRAFLRCFRSSCFGWMHN